MNNFRDFPNIDDLTNAERQELKKYREKLEKDINPQIPAKTFGQFILKARIRMGLSIKDVAQGCGLKILELEELEQDKLSGISRFSLGKLYDTLCRQDYYQDNDLLSLASQFYKLLEKSKLNKRII